jgi:hypothetical protein
MKANNYDRMEIYVRREDKRRIMRRAMRRGLSVSKYVVLTALGEIENGS